MITSKKARINVHFPTKTEMNNQIWNKEYHRKPPKNNQAQSIDYKPLIGLMDYYKERADFLLGRATADQIMDETNRLIKVLVKKMLVKLPPQDLLDGIFNYLTEEDGLEKADAIFVHGSPNLFPRAREAVKIFKEGWAPKLVLSGGHPSTDRIIIDGTEAEMFRDYAVKRGVSKNSILVENTSITLAGNVQNTLLVFDQINYHPKSIIIVTGNFCMRRAYGHWLKFTTHEKIIRHAAIPEATRKYVWYKNEGGLMAFLSEYFKLRLSEELGGI